MPSRSYSKPDQTTTVSGGHRYACGTCPASDGWPPYTTVTGRAYGHYSGASTPGFFKLVREKKLLPLNSYHRWDYTGRRSPYTGTYTSHTTSCGDCSAWTHSHPHVAPWYLDGGITILNLSKVDWSALLIKAISNANADFDVATTLAEAHKTVDMVLSARRDAKRLIRQALRGGKYTAKAASDAWLAWRYGWQQLGYDIRNCYELLQMPLKGVIFEGRAGQSLNESRPVYWVDYDSAPWVSPGLNYRVFSHTVQIEINRSVRANAIIEMEGRTLNVLIDPFVTLWELVPYSFVADWFVNVGECLSAWTITRSAKNVLTSIGEKREVSCRVSSTMSVEGPGMYSGSGGGFSVETFTEKFRYPGWVPALIPSLTVELTSKRILDAAALLTKRIF